MLHRLCGPPSIPLSFILANVLLRRSTYCVNCSTEIRLPTLSTHRLRRGLLGYLILFAPHAFGTERQLQTRSPPSPLVFLHISTHFTATHGIPLNLFCSLAIWFPWLTEVELQSFTTDLYCRLLPLYAQ